MLERLFNASWYGWFQWTWLLYPLTILVSVITKRKRQTFLANNPQPFSVPVIVVGNITIGGTGKTPVVQSLVRYLQSLGYNPGIVSRGYGGSLDQFPHIITTDDSCDVVGDEPFMLSRSLGVPVVVDPVRTRGVKHLIEHGVSIVISDDGLQHYQMYRDYEVCVVDGSRGLGNQQIMPVGPLREGTDRLSSVDYVLTSESKLSDHSFQIEPVCWVNVKTQEQVAINALRINDGAMAIAGIGNPEKFKQTLSELNIHVEHKWFSDHYAYSESDLNQLPSQILMTEKDAVKIKRFASKDMWYLQIAANLPQVFKNNIKYSLDNWVRDHG
ncbi:tetraacyldisaccharide 4'-kinase [Oceaniserpentilla sp. 4NH20-0058]|uniref:tetraacyldisaccharide 4'-kinase n=1 Tax=Oceaniserpentilla sp. 4NH20-0058 TaxID=3127660 RepID=UPI0031073592